MQPRLAARRSRHRSSSPSCSGRRRPVSTRSSTNRRCAWAAASLFEPKYQFASDNTAGVCPEAWDAMQAANTGYVASYGEDPHTLRSERSFPQGVQKPIATSSFVFNGTSANSLALASLCQSYHSVICHDSAHVETDECGAPEFFSNGTKLLTAVGAHGKLDLFEVERIITRRNDVHYPKPRVISITQATESGTVYRVDEIQGLAHLARTLYRMHIHWMAPALPTRSRHRGAAPKALTWQSGVDVLCFGGTKNGMAVGEAVVFFNRGLSDEFEYRCKQARPARIQDAFPRCTVGRDAEGRRVAALCPACECAGAPARRRVAAHSRACGCCTRWRRAACSPKCRTAITRAEWTAAGATTSSSAAARG